MALSAVLLTVTAGCSSIPFATGSLSHGRAVSCPAAAVVDVGTIAVPAGPIGGYCQPELVNAAHIINAGRDAGVGVHTQAVGVMTAMGESGLVNLDYGDAAGADSRGLFQQRDNGAWGSLADRMNPYTAATNFFDALMKVPGWVSLTPTQAAHAVQVNADPDYYTSYWTSARTVVTALT
ncbi:CHAP domain-containing protein, partial [Subtercola frigoramans]